MYLFLIVKFSGHAINVVVVMLFLFLNILKILYYIYAGHEEL